MVQEETLMQRPSLIRDIGKVMNRPAPEVELGMIYSRTSLMVYDVEKARILESMTTVSSSRLVILAMDNEHEQACELEQILLSRIQSLYRSMVPVSPFQARVEVQNLLKHTRDQMPALSEIIDSVRVFVLENRRLYSLNDADGVAVFVCRRGALLDYRLGPHHIIECEPTDVLLIEQGHYLKRMKQCIGLRGLVAAESLTEVMREVRKALFTGENPVSAGYLLTLRIDHRQPPPRLVPEVNKAELLGQWVLVSLYALLTGFLLLGIYWLI